MLSLSMSKWAPMLSPRTPRPSRSSVSTISSSFSMFLANDTMVALEADIRSKRESIAR